MKQAHEAENSQFKNTREVNATQHTLADQGTVGGEHVHHHVHENIQPVIQKETIQPNVVHTTIPVHETHHNEAKHHGSSALPAMSMHEFKNQGGSLSGRETRTDAFEGAPKGHIHETIGGPGAHGTTHLTEQDGRSSGVSGTSGPHNSNLANKADPRVDSDRDGSRNAGLAKNGVNGTHNGTHNTTTAAPGGVQFGNTHDSTHTNTTHKKPSLMDKLNPKVDADGDGKAGFMK